MNAADTYALTIKSQTDAALAAIIECARDGRASVMFDFPRLKTDTVEDNLRSFGYATERRATSIVDEKGRDALFISWDEEQTAAEVIS